VGLLDARQGRHARHFKNRQPATCWPRPAACATAAATKHAWAHRLLERIMDENAYMVQKWNEFVAA